MTNEDKYIDVDSFIYTTKNNNNNHNNIYSQ